MSEYAIVKHEVGLRTRLLGNVETVPMQGTTEGIEPRPYNEGKGPGIPVVPGMWHFIEGLHSDPRAYQLVRRPGMWWINTSYDWESPYSQAKAESIICSHAFVQVDGYNAARSHASIMHFNTDELLFSIASPAQLNWRSRPDLFWKTIVVNKLGTTHCNPGASLDCYQPLLQRPGWKLWLPIKKLEFFKPLPYTGYVGQYGLYVRDTYSRLGNVIGYLAKGSKFTIVRYRPIGASVWGELTGGGWVCLLLCEAGIRAFYTSWSLATGSPIPPAG